MSSCMSSCLVVSSATGLAGADAGVVDQHVEAPEALAVGAHDLLDDRLVGQVAGTDLTS